MKKIAILILPLLCTLASCTGDLDQQPHTSSQTGSGTVYGSEEGCEKALAKLYASFVLAGQGKGGENKDLSSNKGFDLMRSYFNLQELPTDEAAARWLSGEEVADLTYMSWDDTDPWVADTYYRAYYTIALCNEYLSHAGSGTTTLDAYRAEARFLRALAYWYVLDLFGQGPFVDETMGVGAFTPERYSNVQLFNFIESELLDITGEDGGLLASIDCPYGHASNAAGLALLARLYLNAEVYGAEAHYTECIAACKDIMAMDFSLEEDYAKLFNADNDKRTNEIIFPFICDGDNTVTWGGTTYIVCGQCGNDNAQDPSKYGISGGWGSFRVRGELAELFASSEGKDSRGMFYTDGQSQWFSGAIDTSTEGYYAEKFSNLTDEGETASNTAANGASIDFPVFRLADIYLMLAESVLRGGTGSSRTEATELVNQIRQRAYGDESGNINEAQLTLQFILDERARELYYECVRRTDLVRYGQFTSADYLWQWKGGMLDGQAVSDRYNVYPIPAAELSVNPNLSNPNY